MPYVLKVHEVAEMLQLSEQKVRDLVRKGKLKAIRDQRTIRVFNPFTKTQLPKFMDVYQVSRIYRISTAKARQLLREGKLLGYKDGDTYKLTAVVNERPLRIRGFKSESIR